DAKQPDPKDFNEVIVRQDVEAPSSFSLRLKRNDALDLVDNQVYRLGQTVTVTSGTTVVVDGEITSLEIEAIGGGEPEIPSLIVRGYDRRHRLWRGTRTACYPSTTDSEIATMIATRNGLASYNPSTPATSIPYELVIQHEQTDFEFLKERAARIGYEVFIEP